MRRLARRLFTLCSAVSLLLCVALSVLWVRSYWVEDWAAVVLGRASPIATSLCGSIAVSWDHCDEGAPEEWTWQWNSNPDFLVDEGYARRAIFTVSVHGRGVPTPEILSTLTFPHWAGCVMTLVIPVLHARAWRRHIKRSRTGLCPACGYDLRASPERCPECGAAAGRQED